MCKILKEIKVYVPRKETLVYCVFNKMEDFIPNKFLENYPSYKQLYEEFSLNRNQSH